MEAVSQAAHAHAHVPACTCAACNWLMHPSTKHHDPFQEAKVLAFLSAGPRQREVPLNNPAAAPPPHLAARHAGARAAGAGSGELLERSERECAALRLLAGRLREERDAARLCGAERAAPAARQLALCMTRAAAMEGKARALEEENDGLRHALARLPEAVRAAEDRARGTAAAWAAPAAAALSREREARAAALRGAGAGLQLAAGERDALRAQLDQQEIDWLEAERDRLLEEQEELCSQVREGRARGEAAAEAGGAGAGAAEEGATEVGGVGGVGGSGAEAPLGADSAGGGAAPATWHGCEITASRSPGPHPAVDAEAAGAAGDRRAAASSVKAETAGQSGGRGAFEQKLGLLPGLRKLLARGARAPC